MKNESLGWKFFLTRLLVVQLAVVVDAAHAQGKVLPLRLDWVTRQEVAPPPVPKDSQETDTPPDKGPEMEVQARRDLKVVFDVPEGYEAQSGDHWGLFLQRDGGSVASVQRSPNVKCALVQCVALFPWNPIFEPYEVYVPDKSLWFLMRVPNPAVVAAGGAERSDGTGDDRHGGRGEKSLFDLGLLYSWSPVQISESSSTEFNYAKNSTKASWGSDLEGFLSWDGWTFSYGKYAAVLDTVGFFTTRTQTTLDVAVMGLGYRWKISPDWPLFLYASMQNYAFKTGNEDEAIVSTEARGFGAGLQTGYFFNDCTLLNIWTDYLAIGCGGVSGSYEQYLSGTAKDTSQTTRGEKAT